MAAVGHFAVCGGSKRGAQQARPLKLDQLCFLIHLLSECLTIIISDDSFRIPHLAYLANWPPLAILNNRRMRRGHCDPPPPPKKKKKKKKKKCVNVS